METSPQPIAQLCGVFKRYGKVTALDGVDLRVNAGEVLAVLGPNGAGKTTSVHLLMGLLAPDQGEVRLFGRRPDNPAARGRTGVMLQTGGVPATLTVAEHLHLFASYYSRPLSVDRVLEQTGLDGLGRRRAGQLSGGQRQRLMFALALIGDPELLFLDEPTAGLDVGARRRFWQTLRELAAAGRSIVLTTHYLEEADALAERIVVLNHGRVIAEGAPADIKARAVRTRVRCRTRLHHPRIEALPGVRELRFDGSRVELLCSEPEPVVRRLLELDPSLAELEVTGAGLEDAFLSLTENDAAEAAA